tara:strand:+ start:105 stop:416 length:312 start_codon:yes stop_codon:yes gene_type:complete
MFSKGMNMMKQAQQMQKKMAQVQEELEGMRVEGVSGGGMVKSTVNGKKDLIALDIDESVLNEEKDMVEDLILASVNQALKNADDEAQKKMSNITGGMKIPGLF